MEYLCLDLEGVLIPEIWSEVAHHTGEEKFNLTTQDIKDYSELMDMRMKLVNSMNISMSDLNNLVNKIRLTSPLDENFPSLSYFLLNLVCIQ